MTGAPDRLQADMPERGEPAPSMVSASDRDKRRILSNIAQRAIDGALRLASEGRETEMVALLTLHVGDDLLRRFERISSGVVDETGFPTWATGAPGILVRVSRVHYPAHFVRRIVGGKRGDAVKDPEPPEAAEGGEGSTGSPVERTSP